MNALSITGGLLALAGILLMHASDWTALRRFRWSWYPVTTAGVLALLASKAGAAHIVATLIVATFGGMLISVAFISQKTGQGRLDVMTEITRRMGRRKRRQP